MSECPGCKKPVAGSADAIVERLGGEVSTWHQQCYDEAVVEQAVMNGAVHSATPNELRD